MLGGFPPPQRVRIRKHRDSAAGFLVDYPEQRQRPVLFHFRWYLLSVFYARGYPSSGAQTSVETTLWTLESLVWARSLSKMRGPFGMKDHSKMWKEVFRAIGKEAQGVVRNV
jgi:hypothetical protein